ncbi:hypothetical protein EJB05_29388, partial [Eragrostis curvula]
MDVCSLPYVPTHSDADHRVLGLGVSPDGSSLRYLVDATLKQLDLANVSGVLSTALPVTNASRNPNGRVGVYYDRLDVYASYKYQQVTLGASLPPVYQALCVEADDVIGTLAINSVLSDYKISRKQATEVGRWSCPHHAVDETSWNPARASLLRPCSEGHGDVDDWSPVLSGPNVPFAPYLADALGKDVANGYLIMEVKIDDRVRWKVGSWTSGHYHIFVTCPAFFITSGGNGVQGASGLRFQTTTYCHVEV